MSILSASELCLDCAICCRDTGNICICNSFFLIDSGESLTSALARGFCGGVCLVCEI
jgi:hypothetical protein